MTRYAREPYRRHYAGVTWERNSVGRYTHREGDKEFILYPAAAGRSGPVSWTLYVNDVRAGDSWPLRPLDRAMGEASKLVRKERAANDPLMAHPHTDVTFHELGKFSAASAKNTAITEFLDWLKEQDIHLCFSSRGMDVVDESTEKLLARYFEIDLAKLDAERRILLAAQTKKPKTP